MKKLLLLTVVLSVPLSAVFGFGQKESLLDEPPPTPTELEEYAGGASGYGSRPASTGSAAEGEEEEELVLTVERAVEIARERNLDLKDQAVDLRIKERQADYAWNELVPSVQVSG
ncbi:MAG: hypothetical protein ACLFMZ_10200, partial [Spirochaetaceae bacterium]